MTNTQDGKTTAIVSYITIFGTLIAIFMNLESKNEFARFHIRQALGINMLFYALGALLQFSGTIYAAYGLWTCFIILWIYAFSGAVTNTKKLIPVIGTYFQKWFTFIS